MFIWLNVIKITMVWSSRSLAAMVYSWRPFKVQIFIKENWLPKINSRDPLFFLITIMNICSKSGNPVTCFINYTTPRPEMIPILGVKTAGISHMVKAKVQVIIYPATFCRQMLSGWYFLWGKWNIPAFYEYRSCGEEEEGEDEMDKAHHGVGIHVFLPGIYNYF